MTTNYNMTSWQDVEQALNDNTVWHERPKDGTLDDMYIQGGYDIFMTFRAHDLSRYDSDFVVWQCPVLTAQGIKEYFGISVRARKHSAQLYLLGESVAEVIAFMGMLTHADATVWMLCSVYENDHDDNG